MIVNSLNDLALRQIPRTWDFVKDLRANRKASPLCFIYNSFFTSCDGISLTATAFFKDICPELSVEKRSQYMFFCCPFFRTLSESI